MPFIRSNIFMCLAAALILPVGAAEFQSDWPSGAERVWAGPQYWTNPLQDWRVSRGRLECVVSGGDRNAYLLTRELGPQSGEVAMSVVTGRIDADTTKLDRGWVGFKIGIQGRFDDYRDSAVRGEGLSAGMDTSGRLFIGRNFESDHVIAGPLRRIELRLRAKPVGGRYRMVLTARGETGQPLAEVTRDGIDPDWLTGGIALVCSSAPPGRSGPARSSKIKVRDWQGRPGEQRGGNVRFWFKDWKLTGDKVMAHDERAYGPILFAMYTLSRGVMKMTAQMPPLGADAGEVELRIRKAAGPTWTTIARSEIDALSRTATFRVADWDASRDTPYRLVYTMDETGAAPKTYEFTGSIRHDPADQPNIVVAAFTGDHDFGFPHNPTVQHVAFFNPDLLVFTGDQIYEPCGGYGVQRSPLRAATLDYLRKWFIYGWAFRDLLKDRPSVCLPDDHDVYQGNIWGAGGRHAEGFGPRGQDQGGYTMDAQWVKVVHRTQTSHLPDPHDPTPVEQGIPVYYCPMEVGGVSFAVIEDRKWKSAPKRFLPEAEIVNGWAQNPDYDAARQGDAPGAVLLGRRQLDFLEDWAADWSRGAWMKCVVSQTIFANVATLPAQARSDGGTQKLRIMAPGEYAQGEKIVMDHDSNGWPQTGRNKALRAMRRGFALHIAGDQHLGSTIQYGVDDWRDAGFAICVPSIANIFPRRWFPPAEGLNRKPGAPLYTGDFLDGFGNHMTVHAVSNPHGSGVEPAALNDRAPGYGIIEFHRANRKITLSNWPRWVDPSQPGAQPYPGWPIVIDQTDNYNRKAAAFLPALEITGMDDPVVQIVEEPSQEIVYTLRIQGHAFRPKVFRKGSYTVRVGEPGTANMKRIEHVASIDEGQTETMRITF